MKNLLLIAATMGVLVSLSSHSWAQEESTQELSREPSSSETPLPLDQIKTFAEVFARIKANYVEEVSDEQLFEYAIDGILKGLDPHSSYYSGEKLEDLEENRTGSFTGLGMEVVMEGGFVKVIAPIDDTPAAKAGIQSGDLIVRMDGKTVSGLSLRDATNRMRGKPGTKIVLTILRESEPDPFDVEIERAVVRVSSVKRQRFDDEVGYLRVTQFQSMTSETFRRELKMLKLGSGVQGLILDLRNNPGGLLSAAVSISDLFIDEGVIVSTRARNQTESQEYKSTPSDILQGKPIVVLINSGSASASEIVAGALQDHNRALVIGTESFGKGSVQTVLNIDDEKAIKLTTARYYTPNGTSIQAQGITPDLIVEPRAFSEQETRFNALSEDDLPGRLDAGESEEKQERNSLSAETRAMLEDDYQLNEAYNLLKGLVLFSKAGNELN